MTKRILLVNDEADINTTVRHVLEGRGFKIDSYEDPRLALENFEPQYYDLVIIDSKMPQMNGFAFYKGVNTLDKKVKTCFLTAAELQSENCSDDMLSSPLPANYFIRIPIENDAAGTNRVNGSGKMINIFIGHCFKIEEIKCLLC